MRLSQALAAFVLLAAPLATVNAALSFETAGLSKNSGGFFDTTFDLGFDVSGIEHTPAAAKSVLLALDTSRQLKVAGACNYFLRYPYMAQSPETRAFCTNLYQ